MGQETSDFKQGWEASRKYRWKENKEGEVWKRIGPTPRSLKQFAL